MMKALFRRFRGWSRPTPLAWVAIAGGVLVHSLALLVVRVPALHVAGEEPRPSSFVHWGGEEEEKAWVREQALLFDSAPLFIPTPFSFASAIDAVASLEEQAELYGPFRPQLRLDREAAPTEALARRFRPPDTDLLEDLAVLRGTEGFGTRVSEGVAPAPRAPRILVETVTGGEGPHREQWFALPEALAEILPDGLWESPVFFVDVAATGVVGIPVLARGSGTSELDAQMRAHLADSSFGRRVQPGYYRVSLIP